MEGVLSTQKLTVCLHLFISLSLHALHAAKEFSGMLVTQLFQFS